jgi:hypothetical protein
VKDATEQVIAGKIRFKRCQYFDVEAAGIGNFC